ncbi:hypothetical protein BU24DRAFT_408950 [Aaosphaeria arxii CBS 175.79]|uniref:AB hydrolase-1 domain-containing protein n=1 Tax=Aaosphaeria arxii CBS 175.79 TaxID=1450172 RepID=A0A6A5XS74_9PLEO|nr:uncharacterized protein BU24DRAFT_408950 [Aaosphaeria arxii CBS 175.79]KAF2015759.1 hypothetical protein BU24DRAFT_408950 [Aaosphaeria arxii CBS 175.79]
MATLILIPGHWNTPACYDALLTALLSYGYSSATVILPSPGLDAETFDLSSESTEIKWTLTQLSKIRRDVILVLHPTHRRSEYYPRKLEKMHAERSLKSGVPRMIFFMSYMSPRGFNETVDGNGREILEDPAEFELERGTVTVDSEGHHNVLFQYLPASEAQHWAARMLPESVGKFWSTSQSTGWRHIPSRYMLHSDHRSFRVPYAHYKIERTRELSFAR